MPIHQTQARQLTLAAHPSAVPWARRLADQALREWHLTGLSDTALLLVSELVTNAVRASARAAGAGAQPPGAPGPGGHIGLTLRRLEESLVVQVWDASPALPVLREPAADADSGRGLLLVQALSSEWGQEPAEGGKVVWCELEIPAAAASGACPRPA